MFIALDMFYSLKNAAVHICGIGGDGLGDEGCFFEE